MTTSTPYASRLLPITFGTNPSLAPTRRAAAAGLRQFFEDSLELDADHVVDRRYPQSSASGAATT